MNWPLLGVVMAGGALGAAGRHLVGGWMLRHAGEGLPWGTLAVNLVGSFAAGLLFARLLNFASGGSLNPLIGAAGISAFPMAARVVNKLGLEEDFENFLLMHAMGANTAGQIGSVVAGGVLLALLGH